MEPVITVINTIGTIFTWRSTLDIILIAACLFFLNRTLIRLGTWKIMAGILTAIVVLIIASLLDLTTIKWLYSNVSHVALIALIVIFQPELRKLFERAASLRRNKVDKNGTDLSESLSDAIFTLAEQRRGAIFVFPGREPIVGWIAGGVLLNADPSFPLVMSIFDPNSPGHDGALIVENGKFTRFGVRLPISQTDKLPQAYGTRHHAAMGLSEVSDAFIVVVSEERGSVTTFDGGTVKTVRSKKQLVDSIRSYWERTGSYISLLLKGRSKKHLIFELFLSFLLAFVFWTTLTMSQQEIREKVFSIPIVYKTPENSVLIGEKPTEIKVYVAGPQSEIDTLTSTTLSVNVDLSQAQPGKQTVVITNKNIKLPKNVRMLDAEPSELAISLAKIVEKEVIVKPQFVGKLPHGLELKSIRVMPQKIKALYPASKEERELSVMTTPIYLDSIRENTTLFCKITARPHIQPADKRWPDIEVHLVVNPKQ